MNIFHILSRKQKQYEMKLIIIRISQMASGVFLASVEGSPDLFRFINVYGHPTTNDSVQANDCVEAISMGNTSGGESRDPLISLSNSRKMKVGRNSFCGVGDSKKNISLVCTKIGAHLILKTHYNPASSSSFIPISIFKVALSQCISFAYGLES